MKLFPFTSAIGSAFVVFAYVLRATAGEEQEPVTIRLDEI